MSEKPNENSANEERDDELEINAESPKLEENDNWEFEAKAQTLDDTFIENDEMVIEIPKKKSSAYETRERPKAQPKTEEKKDEEKTEKKPKKDERNTTIFLLTAIIAVIIIGALAYLGIRYYTVPATIGATETHEVTNPGNVALNINGTKVTRGMYSYYYNQILNSYASQAQQGYYDLDVTKDLNKQYTTDDDGKKITWQKKLTDETEQWLQQLVAYYNMGSEDGIKLTADEKKTNDEQIKTVKDTAKQNKQSVDEYIEDNYGDYVTLATLNVSNEWYVIAQNYARKMATEIHPTVKEAQAYYNKNKNDYNQVKFALLPMTYTDKNKADVQKQAQKYASQIKNVKDLKKLIPTACKDLIDQYVEAGTMGDADAVADQIAQSVEFSTTQSNENQYPDEVIKFLFDSKNKVGSTTTVTSDQYGAVYVVLKESEPAPNTDETYTVRHILIMPYSVDKNGKETDAADPAKASADQWKNAEQKANKVYEEFKKTDKSEYQFALLAEKYSKDPGSISSGGQGSYGGIYYKTSLGTMVKEFEKWATDKSRKYGDTAIVKTEYGYHIMYFVNDEPDYIMDCMTAVSVDEENALVDKYKVEANKRGVEAVIDAINLKVKNDMAASSSAQSSSSASEDTTSASQGSDD